MHEFAAAGALLQRAPYLIKSTAAPYEASPCFTTSLSPVVLFITLSAICEANGRAPPCYYRDRSIIRNSSLLRAVRATTGDRKKGRGRTYVLHYQTSERGSPPIFIISYSQNDRCDDRCPWLGTYHFGIPVPGGV